MVPKGVVDLFEFVEVDIDEAEDSGLLASFVDEGVETLVEREAVVGIGEQVELGSAPQVGVETAGFDGQRR